MRGTTIAGWGGLVLALGVGASACGGASAHVAGASAVDVAVKSTSGATACAGQATVTAQGEGSASQAPDELTIVGNVTTSATEAAAALAENDTEAATAITRLRTQVSAADLQTSGLTINPEYSSARVPTIVGYQVIDTVTAQIKQSAPTQNWTAAGALIDAVVSKSANSFQLQSITFSVADDGGLVSLAQAAGVTQAAAQASAMAHAAGLTLGSVCAISDAAPTIEEPVENQLAFASASGGSTSSVPLAAGSQKDSEAVTVTYLVG